MPDKTIPCKIRNKRWTLVFTRNPDLIPKGTWGVTKHWQKLIAIHPDQKGQEAIGTVIHEWLHGFFPDAKEEVILQAESELVGLLDDLGMLADEWATDEI